MAFSDAFAEQTFDALTKELRANIKKVSSQELGSMLVPMLMETANIGRTRHIRVGSMYLLKEVLAELGTRDDCTMGAIEKRVGDKDLTEEEVRALMDAQAGTNNVKPLLDALDEKIKAEEEAAKTFDAASVDAILSAPMHPDVAGRK